MDILIIDLSVIWSVLNFACLVGHPGLIKNSLPEGVVCAKSMDVF